MEKNINTKLYSEKQLKDIKIILTYYICENSFQTKFLLYLKEIPIFNSAKCNLRVIVYDTVPHQM